MKNKQFYIYGKQPILELLQDNPQDIKKIFIKDGVKSLDFNDTINLARKNKITVQNIPGKKIKEYVGDVNAQGIVALIDNFRYADFNTWLEKIDIDKNPAVLILDHIEDPQNFGAIIRTAAACGIAGIIIAKDKQSPVNATVFKTSAGAVSKIPIIQVSNIVYAIETLKKNKFWIAGISMEAEQNLWQVDMSGPMGFVVGGEGSGVSRLAYEKCDFGISLPMENDIESLNVSVATAVVVYEWKRLVG